MKKLFLIAAALLTLAACAKEKVDYKLVTINEVFQTPRIEADNTDSPAFYQKDSLNWIISTAKVADVLIVNDAVTGKGIKRVGGSGSEAGKLERPNGVWVAGDLCFVVERDNHRVQVFSLPEFETLGSVGEKELIKPYGLSVIKRENGFCLFVTDNYETDSEEIPADSNLNDRVHHYSVKYEDGNLSSELIRKFGDTSGEGRLKVVESIYADTLHKNILIAEELESETCVKVYGFDGNYKGVSIGKGLFKHQAEGITLIRAEGGKGYWVLTDQSLDRNVFHVFDRVTFDHLGGFIGPKTTNTDGIWLTQKPYANFSKGAFFAVHNDGNVSAFNLSEIADSLNLKF